MIIIVLTIHLFWCIPTSKGKTFALAREGHKLLRPYADNVRGKIRELRVQYRTNQYRILYFFFQKDFIVLLHGFNKKTQKVSERDIEQAERNMQDFISRYKAGEIKF